MSSILQALKKLEQETAAQTRPNPPLLPAAGIPGRSGTSRTRKKKIFVSLLIGFALLALFGLYWQNDVNRPEHRDISQQDIGKTRPGETAPASNSEQAAQEKEHPSTPSQEADASLSASASAGKQDQSPGPGKQKDKQGTASQPLPSKDRSPAPQTNEGGSSKAKKTKTSPASTDQKRSFAGLQHRKKNGYALQALVWSQEAAKRWAMVNGQSVRAGGYVNQARVVHIGRDFIVFEKGGEMWKHIFLK